jgi:hypothetical protein
MSRRLMIAIATGSTLAVWFYPSDAVADSVPNWDVTASCRGAATAGYVQDTSQNLKNCLDSEHRTREQLDKNWSTFPAADRIECVKTQTFEPTYTELATCLEMKRDIQNAAKPADAVPPKK